MHLILKQLKKKVLKLSYFEIFIFFTNLFWYSFSSAQILNDFQVYYNGSIPALHLGKKGEIHLAYTATSGIKYLILDSLLNIKIDTIEIDNTQNCSDVDIDVNLDRTVLAWRKITVHGDFIQGTVFENNYPIIIDSLMTFNESAGISSNWFPKLSFLNDTSLVVVWYGYSQIQPLYKSIYGQIVTTSNKLIGTNFFINEHDIFEVNSKRPLVRSFPFSDDFLVVWIDDYNYKDEIYGRLFFADGIPQDSSFLITDNSNFANLFYIALDMDSAGNFVVVWSAVVDSCWNIFYKWFDKNGSPISETTKLTAGLGNVNEYSDVDCSVSENGNFIVVWEQNIGGFSRIYAQRFSADRKPIGLPFRVSQEDRPLDQLSPRVVLSEKYLYTFWGYSDNSVWANILDFDNPLKFSKRRNEKIYDRITLYQNYPNPFNNNTTFSFYLKYADHVIFNIYNINGQKIKTMVNRKYMPGYYKIYWDGTDSFNNKVSSGIYIGKLITSYSCKSIKILLMR